MAVKVGINGIGRVGRLVLRALAEQGLLGKQLDVVAVNDPAPVDNLAYLLRYDSAQGRFPGSAEAEGDTLVVNGHRARCLAVRGEPRAFPWRELGVEYVVEAADGRRAREHLDAGTRKVVLTAAAREDLTVVVGVNHDRYDPASHHVVSAGTATVNCVVPVLHVLLKEGFGVEEGIVTVTRAGTESQKTVDGPARDWRGGRASGVNIVPSGGSLRAVGRVLPELNGKLEGTVFRVPVQAASVAALAVRTARAATYTDVCAAMERAGRTYLKGVLGYTRDPVVSSDFVHDPHSATFDAAASFALNDQTFSLVCWYDAEWAFASRCADLLAYMAARG